MIGNYENLVTATHGYVVILKIVNYSGRNFVGLVILFVNMQIEIFHSFGFIKRP